jgi:dUTPase
LQPWTVDFGELYCLPTSFSSALPRASWPYIPDAPCILCRSSEACTIPARGKGLVKTDLQIGIPPGTYARVAPRSGLAWKHSIDVGAGVVDEDYRGPVGVILFNHGDKDFEGELAWALYRDEFAGHGLF